MTSDDAIQAAHILLADDDPAIRKLFAAALRSAGFVVELAADGDEALAAIERGCPALLLADLVMPGLTGDVLARRVREHCPHTALIFMSGYTEERLHELDIKQVVFLPKPISPRELVEVIRRVLDEANGRPQPR
jgi:DNA-binding response OmpR family regulator